MATDPKRNTPTEKGRDNDPNLRDETAIQPGVSTVSNSDYDNDNDELTRTAADDFSNVISVACTATEPTSADRLVGMSVYIRE